MVDQATLEETATPLAPTAPAAGSDLTHRGRSKRAIDIVLAGILVVVLSPLAFLVAILIRRHDKGPVLYQQQRIGHGGRPFQMLKFRSMQVNSDDSALRAVVEGALSDNVIEATNGSFKLEDDPRITPIGRWLRASSIDELPQLLNVLRGDMTLVGPRPALPWEVERFPAESRRRTDVMPGITGLWQVSGRSRVNTRKMLQYDLEYVDTQSLSLDLRILCRTIPTLVRRDGAR